MKRKRNNEGFTLVELMVVAIIVAILAAVAIPLMTANKNRAIATEAEAGCGMIRTALRVYYAEHDSYPTNDITDVTSLTGIGPGDLDGTYFSEGCYSIESSVSEFTVRADGSVNNTAPKASDAEDIWVTLTDEGAWDRGGV